MKRRLPERPPFLSADADPRIWGEYRTPIHVVVESPRPDTKEAEEAEDACITSYCPCNEDHARCPLGKVGASALCTARELRDALTAWLEVIRRREDAR